MNFLTKFSLLLLLLLLGALAAALIVFGTAGRSLHEAVRAHNERIFLLALETLETERMQDRSAIRLAAGEAAAPLEEIRQQMGLLAIGQMDEEGRVHLLTSEPHHSIGQAFSPAQWPGPGMRRRDLPQTLNFFQYLADGTLAEVFFAGGVHRPGLFAVRAWEEERLGALEEKTGLQWSLVKIGSPGATPPADPLGHPLRDAEGRPLALLAADRSSILWATVSRELKRQAWILGLFPLLCLMIVTAFLFLRVIQPLKRISLTLQDRAVGRLDSLARSGREFGEVARTIVSFFEQQQALEQASREKERLARDLHDGVIQDLFGLGLRLKCLEQSLCDSCSRDEKHEMSSLSHDINRLIADIRRFILQLEPSLLEGRSLSTALEKLCQGLTMPENCQLDYSFPVALCESLSREEEVHLFHLVHELLSNGIRHSNACRIECHLTESPSGTLALSYRDDGQGFDPAQTTPGRGLANIRERARQLGADLEINTRPGGPTLLALTGF